MANPVTGVNQTGTFANPLYLAQEYLAKRVGEEAAQNAFVAPLVYTEFVIGQQATSAHLRYYAPISTVGAATEAGTLPSGDWSPVSVMITAALEGASLPMSKTFDSVAPQALAAAAKQAGTSLARTVDNALLSQVPNFTAGFVTGSGTSGALAFDDVTTGIANLNSNFAIGPKYAVIHPVQWADLVGSIKNLGYGVASIKTEIDPDTGRQEEVMDLQGVKIRWNVNVATDGSILNYLSGMFCEEALGLVVSENPMVEILPIPQKHAYTIDYTVGFGVGVYRPKFGTILKSKVNV